MARRKCIRHIETAPGTVYYKPAGIRLTELEEVVIELDEFEAVKLADLEGMYQEEAAVSMNVSRQTFGRIISSAHAKIADAIINGKAIRIDGGNVLLKKINSRGNSNENSCSNKRKCGR